MQSARPHPSNSLWNKKRSMRCNASRTPLDLQTKKPATGKIEFDRNAAQPHGVATANEA